MFEEALIERTKDHLALLGRSGLFKGAYLAGGTAVALQLGHRISIDFDFFTRKKFVPSALARALARLGSFEAEQADRGTVQGTFEGVRLSLFFYDHPLIHKPLKYLALTLADLRDIAAMKVDAVASRGVKRDLVDLYFICQSGYSLSDLLNFYNQKYGLLASNFVHIQKSLVYFEDAEPNPMPRMLKEVRWEEVKKYFINEVKKLAK